MQKIIILGFPHCGTTILRSILGHIDEIYEITGEYINCDVNTSDIPKNKKYIVCKWPYANNVFFTDQYDDYIKIFIIRNPLYVFSSLNKRFPDKRFPGGFEEEHSIEGYINVCKLFLDNQKENNDNTFFIRYEDMFENGYEKLKNIFDTIGFNYTDRIFNNEHYTNIKDNELKGIKKHELHKVPEIQHQEYRAWQINQPFINNNDKNKIELTTEESEKIRNDPIISLVYPDLDNN